MASSPTQASQKQIVVLGGSYGGLSTAHYLLKHAIPYLPDKDSYQVTLISSSSEVMCRPACPRALISEDMFPQDKLFVNIPKLFEQYPKDAFQFINATATELDHVNRTISFKTHNEDAQKLNFYALIIATGSRTNSPLFGLNQDASTLRSTWATFRKALPSAKSIVIVGGGPTGVETAGELGEYLNGRPSWFGSSPRTPKVRITLITSSSRILPQLRPSLAKTAETYLSQLGVTIMKFTRVTSVSPTEAGLLDPGRRATLTLSTGSTVEADLYIPATGTLPNTSFISPTLLAPDKRVVANPSTLRVDNAGPRIYAVGDCANYSRPAIHLILNAIPVLCANVKRDLLLAVAEEVGRTGKQAPDRVKEDRHFNEDTRETQLVPIGGGTRGVGSVMGWSVPGWLVWAVKGRDYWLWTTGGLWSGGQWRKES